MHSRGSAFSKIGITFASFKDPEKIPVTKDWLMGFKIGILIVLEHFW